MSDLFHEDVTFNFIQDVFFEMRCMPNTIFQILTKRPERLLKLINVLISSPPFVSKNVWIGTSCEDQATANERIPYLLQIPASVRFLSCEPLLGEIDISGFLYLSNNSPKDCWVIAGGESGNKKGVRPMHPDWVRSLRDQCQQANVPFFFKQWGSWLPLDHLDEDQYWQSKQSKEVGYGVTSNTVFKLGKSKTGNLLDGKQHLEFPSF